MRLAPLLCTLALTLVTGVASLRADSWAVTGANVFDGVAVHRDTSVLVVDGVIAGIGNDLELPPATEVVDGRGKTLLPGLIDCHTHSFGQALERAAVFGVTTVIDMFTEPGFASARREEQAAGAANGRADLISAGVLATAPGGHGTQYGIEIPTLTTPTEAAAWVDDRLAEGSDFIKIVLEDGALFGRPLPTLDEATATALVEAARARETLALAHVTTFAMGERAQRAGADGLVHLFRDQQATARWVDGAAASGLFMVPTLTVVESSAGLASGASLVEDERLSGYLTSAEIGSLQQSFPTSADASMDNAFATVGALVAAKVPVLAGTDAPNPGTAHGVSMHRELELLVAAGLEPAAALRAATALPADIFSLDDRGRIAVGKRADLILVTGDPTTDILSSRAIERVWKAGTPVARPTQDRTAAPRGPVEGRVADFDDGELSAAFGAGWTGSTDEMMGGKSVVSLEITTGGAADSSHALRLQGEIRSGFAWPWAGAMLFPGPAPMAPVDLSGHGELAFWVRGDAGTYRLMAFAESLGQMPTAQSFEVTAEWSEIVLELDAFPGLDASGVTGLLWTGGPAAGPFEFEIDQIELRP